MLSEPRNKQKNIKLIHQFVVLNHMLTSHIATLSYYVKPLAEKYASNEFDSIISNTTAQLQDAIAIIHSETVNTEAHTLQRHALNRRVQTLLEKRREELQHGLTNTETRKTLSEFKSVVDQFNFISKIAFDIKKICLQAENA
jgi:hypothetical protein